MCVHPFVCVQIQDGVFERYWQGFALLSLSSIVVLPFASKVAVADTVCESRIKLPRCL